MTRIKGSKANFIQDHRDRGRDHCNGVLQQGREIGHNSECNKKKWELIAKEQHKGSVDRKLLREEIKVRGILARPTQQDSC